MFKINIIALGILGLVNTGCVAHGHIGVPAASAHISTHTAHATTRPMRPGPNYVWVGAHYRSGIYITGRWVYRAPAATTTTRTVVVTPQHRARPPQHRARPPASHQDRHPEKAAGTKVWVPGHYVGRGANRRWVPGHYVRRR